MQSKFRIISKGIVAVAKEESSKFIEVYPVEILPLMEGELRPSPTEIESKGVDGMGVRYVSRANVDICLKAEWLSLETNRLRPPDVRRGEEVLIYQYGDTDQYFWTSTGRHDHLRRLETVTYAWSNESDPGKDIELGPENTYYCEVSTHRKHITIATSKNDGESFKYTIQINTADSNVTITDDANNFITIDSAKTLIQLHNSDGTNLELNKKDINAYAPKDMNVVVDNNVNIKVGVDFTMDVGNNTTVKTGMAMALFSTNYINEATAAIMNKTASYTTVCPMNVFTGSMLIGGALAISGGGGGGGSACAVTGNMEIEGAVTIDGVMNVTGVVNAGGFNAPGGKWHNP